MRTVILFLVMFICVNSVCRARIVRGTVYDSFTQKPLRGVLVKAGIAVQATTDAGGHYAINMPQGMNALVFGHHGYVQQTVKVKASDTLNVWLRSSYAATDSVAVAGYSTNTNDEYKIEERVELAPVFVGRLAGVSASRHRKSKLLANFAYKSGYSDVLFAAPQPNDESYQQVSENGFTNPMQVPLSTFAVDVDAASYSNFRRYINSGQLPPADAVRIEEMINYFHYQLPEPEKGAPVAIKTELSAAPWNPAHRLLRIGLKAKTVETDKLPPSSLVFLIDVSGSMSDANKLPLVKSAMKLLVDQLRPVDKVAIVTYAGEVAIKLPATPGSEKIKIKEVIDALGSGGSTAGGAGIRLAYNVARQAFIKGGNNRIVLATDGDFNVGPSSDKDMLGIIEEERNSGVSISILGFGMGNLKDSKMELMADKGHGNYAYIDNITEATKSMVSEFGGTLFTVAKDVKLQIEFNPAIVQAYRLIGYENRLLNKEDFNDDKKLGGDMGVGHTVTALYEIIPAGLKDPLFPGVDPLKYQAPEKVSNLSPSAEMVTIKFRYKQPDGDKSMLQQAVVWDRPLALDKTTDDFRFASSVAELGMLLRKSPLKQQSAYAALVRRARQAKGADEEGYRAEFIRLAESAMLLDTKVAAANPGAE